VKRKEEKGREKTVRIKETSYKAGTPAGSEHALT
jgi:hypothetical protein